MIPAKANPRIAVQTTTSVNVKADRHRTIAAARGALELHIQPLNNSSALRSGAVSIHPSGLKHRRCHGFVGWRPDYSGESCITYGLLAAVCLILSRGIWPIWPCYIQSNFEFRSSDFPKSFALACNSSRKPWISGVVLPRHKAPITTGAKSGSGNGIARTFGAVFPLGNTTDRPIPKPLPT